MKKKITALTTVLMLSVGGTISIPTANAQSLHSIKDQRQGVHAELSKTNAAISQAQSQLANLDAQIKRADQAIIDNNNMITSTEKKIVDTKTEVKELHQEVGMIKDRIAKRNEILKQRALSFQESGGDVNYLDVILGATSFDDLVERIGAVTTMVQADQDLLNQSEVDKQDLEKKQAAVTKKLSDLNAMKTELLGMQSQIAEQKAENDALKEQLKKMQQLNLAKKSNLQQLDHNLASIEASIEYKQPQGTPSASSSAGNTAGAAVSNDVQPSGNGDIDTVIRSGYKYIGNSVYVFGGGRTSYDVANGRFDCSGFVHWAYAQGGISVGSSTDSLIYAGRQVSSNDLRPGDLVFFNTYKRDGHVGIYIGGGRFIGSQSSTGVAVADMTSGYWKQHFNGRVVRVVN